MVAKKFLTIVGLSLFLFASFAGENENSTSAGYSKALKTTVGKFKRGELSKVVKDASFAVWQTQRALELLRKGNKKEAMEKLQKVSALLEKLQGEYGLKKLPIDVRFLEYSTQVGLKEAEELNKRVKKYISENDFVSGRFTLDLLRDEIDVITTYLPLDIYKSAVDLGIKFLKENRVKSAILALESALSTLEVETTVVPKPLLKVQVLLDMAKKVYKTNPPQALKLVEKAQRELKMTVALGYASSEEQLKPLKEKIAELQRAIKEHLATTEEKFKETKQKLQELKKNLTVSY